jgi:cytoskeletal protein RodZ
MFQLGRALAGARQRAGLSQEELADVAGIPHRFVLLIEDGRLDLLPEQAHARGYIRTYAAAVGLDQEAVTLSLCQMRDGASFVMKDLAQLVVGLQPNR